MRYVGIHLLVVVGLSNVVARGEAQLQRPDPRAAEPIATCKLQTVTSRVQPQYEQLAVGLYSVARPAEDALANYERTPLGDWPMPAEADRDDPWLRLLLLSSKRPVVIDVAVFIDGKASRDSRETWIDDVIADAEAAQAPAGDSEGIERSGNNNSQAAGTNTSDEASEGESTQSPAAADERNETKEVPGIAAQARQAPTMRERLMSYLAMSGAEADRAEIGWLLAEWGAGPAVVVLAPGLSWQRASLAPLLTYLDQDVNGALSASEIGQVETFLKRADFNGDDVVEVSEIRRATQHPPAAMAANGHPLIVRLDANTDWESLAATVDRIYGAHGGASPAESRELLAAPVDIALRIDFSTAQNQENASKGVAVLSIREELSASSEAVVVSGDVLSVDVGGDVVEFAAAQAPAGNSNNASASQIAIGAVIDGNPLLRLVDRDQDGRLTLRERQELGGLLTALDRNEDGNVSNDEIPTPIRLAVTLGPQVHQLLANPTGSVRSIAPREAAATPPDWFVSMDKNNDRDLSRGEFLGTTEQFRQFDADSDGLLSIAEALKLNAGQ